MRKIARRKHLAQLGIAAAGLACFSYTLPGTQHELSRPFEIALGETLLQHRIPGRPANIIR